jgi:hypothetical protein
MPIGQRDKQGKTGLTGAAGAQGLAGTGIKPADSRPLERHD